MNKTCQSCGAANPDDAVFCTTCGAMPLDELSITNPIQSLMPTPSYPPYSSDRNFGDASQQSRPTPYSSSGAASPYQPNSMFGGAGGQVQPINVVIVNQGKSKSTAALLAFFLGGLGIHRFYLGYNGIGIAQLLLLVGGFVTCGVTSIAAEIWAFIDFILILTGSISKDSQGNPLV
jgi:TM2 domain-containing membrane protein YozV